MSKHTKLPWEQRIDNPIHPTIDPKVTPTPEHVIYGAKNERREQRIVASAWFDDEEGKANAEFIVRTVNAQPEIVALLGTVSRVFPDTYQGKEAKRLLKKLGSER